MFTLSIKTDNAAFENGATEIHRILTRVARRVADGEFDGTIQDYNGNTVGRFATTGGDGAP